MQPQQKQTGARYLALRGGLVVVAITAVTLMVLPRPVVRLPFFFLTTTSPLPSGSPATAYVFGGSTGAMRDHYRRAGELYRAGVVGRVVIPHNPTRNRYDPALERNLSTNEWSRRQLARHGVPDTVVDTLDIKSRRGLPGTWSEARMVARYCADHALPHIICISSREHTARIRLIVAAELRRIGAPSRVIVTPSEHRLATAELPVETVKLLLYHGIALWRQSGSASAADG